MDATSGASAIVAKQRHYPHHARVLHEATPLTQAMLEQSLVACFEAQAAATPQHLAVEAAEGALTYGALNQAANQLAHHLLAMGRGAGDKSAPVALLLERSLHTVVAMLAVLKTGTYYLCLEPTLPAQRAQDILTRAATQTLITTRAFAAYADEVSPVGKTRVFLDQPLAELPTHNPALPIKPSDPSRLGFTSGSTGTPKPSLKTHENYLYGAWQSSNAYLLSPADRHAIVYQLSAGPSMRALYSALLTGGSVHLYPSLNYDMSNWAAWIEREAITQLYMPTAAFRELLHARSAGPNFPSVRMVYVGGQTIFRKDAEMFQQCFSPGAILVSRYSMSETSGLAHYLVDHDTHFDGETLPIGYALPGRQLLIVDETGHPLGFNQPGEIVVQRLFARTNGEIGAGSVASAATGAPEADDENALSFHTADLGLLRPDGCLIHLGRKDDMVKVRGNRVALAEAENLLLKVSGVAQAAVKPFPTPSGDNRLVGYVVPIAGAQLSDSGVRHAMNQWAPAFMVPARIVVLPTLPLTATGKVDRQALPPPVTARPDLSTPYVAPRHEREQQLADIWAELLGVDDIGIYDDFFELGGDSITAMRMILRAEALTATTTPQDYLRAPTIAALSALDTMNALETSSRATALESARIEAVPARHGLLTRLIHRQVSSTALLNGLSRAMINRRVLGLSYAEAVRWLAWIAQPAISQRIFRQEFAGFRTVTQEVAHPATVTAAALDKAFAANVVANLLRYNFQHNWRNRRPADGNLLHAMRLAPERIWRTLAAQFDHTSPDKLDTLFRVRGLEHLADAQQRQQGIILLSYHSAGSPLSTILFTHQTNLGQMPTISMQRAAEMAQQEGDELGHADDEAHQQNASAGWAANYALHAQRILHNGGAVRIINDMSYEASNSIPKTIGQRIYHLKPGFAELALTTGASVVPLYSSIDLNGCIHLTLLPALTAPANRADTLAGIHNYLDQYVAFIETTWRKSPESISWGSADRYFHLARAGRELNAPQLQPQSRP